MKTFKTLCNSENLRIGRIFSSRLLVLLAFLLLGFNVTGKEGEEDENDDKLWDMTLEELMSIKLSTATRLDRSAFDIPRVIHVINGNDIRKRSLKEGMPESLEESPSVMIQKTSRGQSSPFIRGFTGYQNLLMIDGIRMNNSVFRSGPNQYWSTVDYLMTDQIDLVKGPSSVLYGSDAVGGTVNVKSNEINNYGDGFNWKRHLYYRYASAERANIGRAEIDGNIGDKFGFFIGGSLKDFGDLEGGEEIGTQKNTGYDEWGVNAKFQYNFKPHSKLIFAYQGVNQDGINRAHKTVDGIVWEGTESGSDKHRLYTQNRDLSYLRFINDDLGGFISGLETTVSYQTMDEQMHRLRSNDRVDIEGFGVNTLGLGVQLNSDSKIGNWVYGVEYYYDDVSSFKTSYNADGTLRGESIQGPVSDDANYGTFGTYVQNEFSPLPKLDVILGLRYSHFMVDARKFEDPSTGEQNSLSSDWGTLIGSSSLGYSFNDHLKLFGSISQSFRAPNLSDLTAFSGTRSNEIEVPVSQLDPEKYMNYEIGVKVMQNYVNGQIAYFRTNMSDLVTRVPTGNLIGSSYELTKINSGHGYVEGVEVDFTFTLSKNITARPVFTYIDGQIDTYASIESGLVTDNLSKFQPTTFILDLGWKSLNKKYWANVISTFAAKQDQLSKADEGDTQRIPPGGTPGYQVFTIRGGMNFTENLSLSLGLENITNADYRIHGSGINEPGRNFIAAMNFTF